MQLEWNYNAEKKELQFKISPASIAEKVLLQLCEWKTPMLGMKDNAMEISVDISGRN